MFLSKVQTKESLLNLLEHYEPDLIRLYISLYHSRMSPSTPCLIQPSPYLASFKPFKATSMIEYNLRLQKPPKSQSGGKILKKKIVVVKKKKKKKKKKKADATSEQKSQDLSQSILDEFTAILEEPGDGST